MEHFFFFFFGQLRQFNLETLFWCLVHNIRLQFRNKLLYAIYTSMKTGIIFNIGYHMKPQKQRETYVLFAVTLFFRENKKKQKTNQDSVFFWFCFHISPCGCGQVRGKKRGKKCFTERVQTWWGKHRACFVLSFFLSFYFGQNLLQSYTKVPEVR